MQITVEEPDEMCREAELRELPLIDSVVMLMAKGGEVLEDRPAVDSAIERIRALRARTNFSDGGDRRSPWPVDAVLRALIDW